jgi:hypothetical protein
VEQTKKILGRAFQKKNIQNLSLALLNDSCSTYDAKQFMRQAEFGHNKVMNSLSSPPSHRHFPSPGTINLGKHLQARKRLGISLNTHTTKRQITVEQAPSTCGSPVANVGKGTRHI